MLKESELKVGSFYKIPDCPNRFIMFDKYHPNELCFKRLHDNYLHYGREFIEYEDGWRKINLEEYDGKANPELVGGI